MRIVDYKLIHFSHYDYHYGGESFEQKVKAEIAKGWQPIGGPTSWDTGDKLVQAMVRYTVDPSEAVGYIGPDSGQYVGPG